MRLGFTAVCEPKDYNEKRKTFFYFPAAVLLHLAGRKKNSAPDLFAKQPSTGNYPELPG